MSSRRVIVTLDTAGSATAVSTAVEVARFMEADLLGLFVEDARLLSLAALPFAGEVGFPTSIRRNLDPAVMEGALRAQAQRIRRDLGARLADEPVKWTFEVARGRIASVLGSVTAERDIVVVAVPRAAAGETGVRAPVGVGAQELPAPLLLVSGSARSDGTIAIVCPPSVAPQELARVVAALAGRYGRTAMFVHAESEAAHWDPWRRPLEERLAEHAVVPRFFVVADGLPCAPWRGDAGEPSRIVVALARTPSSRDALLEALPWPALPGGRRAVFAPGRPAA